MILAVIGGIGAGKSTVLDLLEQEYSFQIYRTDDIAKELYHPGNKVYGKLLELFGEKILCEDSSEIDKKALAKSFFGNPALTKKVDEIVHPAVWDYVFQRIEEARIENQNIVIETALPTEDFLKRCDHCLFVYTEREARIQRLMASRSYSREEAEARIQSQRGDDKYRELADIEINNSGTKEDTIHEIYQYFQRLQW